MATTTTRERPILMSEPMVNAILAGRKTMTRRTVKPQPEVYQGESGLQFEWPNWHGSLGAENFAHYCPYGTPRDHLWVREAFLPCRNFGDQPIAIGLASYVCFRDGSQKFYGDGYYHQEPPREGPFNWPSNAKWRPSIHMPRWASRITLELTSVRVERLQAITEADAIAEGARRFESIPLDPMHARDPAHAARWSMLEPTTTGQCLTTARYAFGNLWEKINGEGSWDANPWVWMIGFRRIGGTP